MKKPYAPLDIVFLPKCGNLIWKKEFVKELSKMNNDQLFERTLEEQEPDDWDGCFTKRQRWKAAVSLDMLRYKLINDGWLSDDS